MTDLKHIIALAEAATPGPWHHCQAFQKIDTVRTIHGPVYGTRVDYVSTWQGQGTPKGHTVIINMEGRESRVRSHDMAFIAAANPATVKAMAERLMRLEEALAKAVADYGKPGGPWNIPSDPGAWITMAREALEAKPSPQFPPR